MTSPCFNCASPHERATVLIAAVVPAVKMISRGLGRVDETARGFASRLIRTRRLFAERMDTAVHVAVVTLVAIAHRIDHCRRVLSAGGVVEIDQRFAAACVDAIRRGSLCGFA